jgi:tetratricopeptide (TPR) repeat protein
MKSAGPPLAAGLRELLLRRQGNGMTRRMVKIIQVCLGLLLLSAGSAWAQGGGGAIGMDLNAAYVLLEAGKIDQAQGLYARILTQDPQNPLALNNMGAVMAQKKQYEQALGYLKQALAQAKGLKASSEGTCDVAGLCVALRLADRALGTEDLEEMIRVNIITVQLAATDRMKKMIPAG